MPKYTKKQQQAIADRNLDILVSASAGSGKTSVLTKRVLTEVLAGTDIEQLLIVTFTKAAAQEMKNRIKQGLEQSLAGAMAPEQKRYLHKQLNQVDTANISTIDAFCLDVIHRFYYVIDLDPSFSVLTDETQAALLKERALHEIEGEYLDKADPDFIAFYDNFAGDRDDQTAQDLLLDLYNVALTKPDYQQWLKQLPKQYQISEIVPSKLWQQEIKPQIITMVENLATKIDQLLETSQLTTKELSKVNESFNLFANNLKNFYQAVKQDDDYDEQRNRLRSCVFTGNYRKSAKWDEDLQASYQDSQALKSEAKDIVFKLFSSFYATDHSDQVTLLAKGEQIMRAIAAAELALIERFNQLKRSENLLDYNDMEQLAYQILSKQTSAAQMAREFYQHKFKEILVDEYQDINPLQEKLLQLVKQTGQNNLFMVGDVKQSIYGFRQAEPSLFLEKYHEAAKAENHDQEQILLVDNFRSTKPVISLVNQVFSKVLSSDFGGIDYAKEGKLVFGAQYYPDNLPNASEIFYASNNKSSDEETAEADPTEITMVIERIKQLKREHFQIYDTTGEKAELRPFKYSDIAILTRSRSNNLKIMQAFNENDIPIFVTDAKNYFQTLELTLIMNYLKIIDNPDQDIPLVTVLRSPIFNFKEPDFAKIRIHSKNTSFYNALTAYVVVSDELSQRVKSFLNQLEQLRQFATNHRISELIWSIYEQTNLLEIMTALPNGEQRRVNLESLYERATSYESAGFKGLYSFINFIERMRRSQKDLAQPLLTKEAGDAVRLMTVHGSKGLEFPIVFYLGLQHNFQKTDLQGNYNLGRDAVGLTIRCPQYRADSLVKVAVNFEQQKQLLEEEARVLYVGFTRAKQKLILVADIKDYAKKVPVWQNQANLSLTDKLAAQNPLDLVGPALWTKSTIDNTQLSEVTNGLDRSKSLLFIRYDNKQRASSNSEIIQQQTAKIKLLDQTTKALYDFTYPFKDASQTTAYQAVSEIKRAFNDPIEADLANAHYVPSNNRYLQPIETKPNFLYTTKFTGAEIGTATHLILQYYDYRGVGDEQQLANEIQTLVVEQKLNPQIVPYLQQEQISWFVHSNFAKPFWQFPDQLKREVDFSSLLPASSLFTNFSDPSAKILVHGTIDGYFIGDNGITLFDYKTDHIDQQHLEQVIEQLKQKYTGQLRLYERALNSFAQEKVTHKYLILLDAKKVVEVK